MVRHRMVAKLLNWSRSTPQCRMKWRWSRIGSVSEFRHVETYYPAHRFIYVYFYPYCHACFSGSRTLSYQLEGQTSGWRMPTQPRLVLTAGKPQTCEFFIICVCKAQLLDWARWLEETFDTCPRRFQKCFQAVTKSGLSLRLALRFSLLWPKSWLTIIITIILVPGQIIAQAFTLGRSIWGFGSWPFGQILAFQA